MAVCKYCGLSGLEWEQTLNNKWILLDSAGQKHYCVKPKAPNIKKINSLKDAQIEKALDRFKKEQEKRGVKGKDYYLK